MVQTIDPNIEYGKYPGIRSQPFLLRGVELKNEFKPITLTVRFQLDQWGQNNTEGDRG